MLRRAFRLFVCFGISISVISYLQLLFHQRRSTGKSHRSMVLVMIHLSKQENHINLHHGWLGELGKHPKEVKIITFSSTLNGVDLVVPSSLDSKLYENQGLSLSKTRKATNFFWSHITNNFGEYEWFFRIDDDSFLFVDHLLEFIKEKNEQFSPHIPQFYGYVFKSDDETQHSSEFGLKYPGHGGGMLLNKALMTKLSKSFFNGYGSELPIIHPFAARSPREDVLIGYYISELGVPLTNHMGFFVESPDAFLCSMYNHRFGKTRQQCGGVDCCDDEEKRTMNKNLTSPFFDVKPIVFHHLTNVNDIERIPHPIPKTIFTFFQEPSFYLPHFPSFKHTNFETYEDYETYLVSKRTYSNIGHRNTFDDPRRGNSYEDDFFTKIKDFFQFDRLLTNQQVESILSFLFIYTYGGVTLSSKFIHDQEFSRSKSSSSSSSSKDNNNNNNNNNNIFEDEQLLTLLNHVVHSGFEMFIIHDEMGQIIMMGSKIHSFCAFHFFKDLHFFYEQEIVSRQDQKNKKKKKKAISKREMMMMMRENNYNHRNEISYNDNNNNNNNDDDDGGGVGDQYNNNKKKKNYFQIDLNWVLDVLERRSELSRNGDRVFIGTIKEILAKR